MYMVPYNKNKIGALRGRSDNYSIIQEFLNSDNDCVEIMGYTNINAKSCTGSLNITIKRYRIFGVKSVMRKGKVYLIKTDI